jgi:hypothetical protein
MNELTLFFTVDLQGHRHSNSRGHLFDGTWRVCRQWQRCVARWGGGFPHSTTSNGRRGLSSGGQSYIPGRGGGRTFGRGSEGGGDLELPTGQRSIRGRVPRPSHILPFFAVAERIAVKNLLWSTILHPGDCEQADDVMVAGYRLTDFRHSRTRRPLPVLCLFSP